MSWIGGMKRRLWAITTIPPSMANSLQGITATNISHLELEAPTYAGHQNPSPYNRNFIAV